MTSAYEKIWEEQQKMLDQWMKTTQSFFQPPEKEEKTKKNTQAKPAETLPNLPEWAEFFNRSYQQWMEAQQEMQTQWWKNLFGPAPVVAAEWDFSRMWKESLRQWGNWIEQSGNYWPFNQIASPATEREWLLKSSAEWLTAWSKFWKPRNEFLEKMGLDPNMINTFLSNSAFRQAMASLFPAQAYNWTSMMTKLDEMLDRHINFLQDIDLPFDEIASFWDRLLMRFLPAEEAPLFHVGSDLHQNLEKMVNPFYSIAGPPKVLQWWKLWQNVQFLFAAFLLKNAQLRGKILEASVAVMPETLKTLNEELEQTKEVPAPVELTRAYTNHLEAHLGKLLKSDEYSKIQSNVAEAGVALKAKIDELVELSVAGLPLITRSDEDDLARELEALRVKVRRLERATKSRPKKEDKLSEQLN